MRLERPKRWRWVQTPRLRQRVGLDAPLDVRPPCRDGRLDVKEQLAMADLLHVINGQAAIWWKQQLLLRGILAAPLHDGPARPQIEVDLEYGAWHDDWPGVLES